MTTENWKDIAGFEGRYQVSDLGRVRNACGHVLRAQKQNSGYLVVHLYLGARNHRRVRLVHRLVASAFLPGNGYVNHINGEKQSNAAWNLEWVTRAENMRHAKASGLLSAPSSRRSVKGRSLVDGSEVFFESQLAAEIALVGKASSAIHHCLSGKKRSAYGYEWSRA